MNRTEVDRILKEGTVKDKINLYFLNIAKWTTRAPLITDNNNPNEIYNYLSDKEDKEIIKGIKLDSDLKYYNKLYSKNNTFMAFRLQAVNSVATLQTKTLILSKEIGEIVLKKSISSSIKEIAKLVEEEYLRDQIIKLALKSINNFDIKLYKEKGYKYYIKLLDKEVGIATKNAVESVKMFNFSAKNTKDFIKGMLSCNYPNVPLKPYKDFLKNEESKAKKEIEHTRELLKSLLNNSELDTEIYIPTYEEIVEGLTEEDLENIKNAGR
jgi:hypothetical protein